MTALKVFLQDLLETTLYTWKANPELSNSFYLSRLKSEYENLEQVGPAPGRPWDQHVTMVCKGLCKRAAANKHANRYCNLFPFDSHIYTFTSGKMKLTNKRYINASWIHFKEGDPGYIVTMAPMGSLDEEKGSFSDLWRVAPSVAERNTIPDFWRMCWETKVRAIVMLCTVSPGSCSQYFPYCPGTTAQHGKFTITHKNSVENSAAGFVEREFTIRKEGKNGGEHRIHQFHYQAWPNYGVPGPRVVEFVTYVHKRVDELNAGSTEAEILERNGEPRLVVHCSGGIGRSGTFLASYVAYSKLVEVCKDFPQVEDPVDFGTLCSSKTETSMDEMFSNGVYLEDVVRKMRTQRHPWMVEELHQYRAAYDIVIQMIRNQIQTLEGPP